jgi:ankyrin repeat protein
MQERKLSGKTENAVTSSGLNITGKKLKSDSIKPNKEKLEKLNIRLLEAARKGKIENAVKLLDAGADVDARNSDGRIPLMLAAYTGYTEMCKLLLDHKADINAIDNYSMTALMLATAGGRAGTAEFLRTRTATKKQSGEALLPRWRELELAEHAGYALDCRYAEQPF